MDKKTVELGQAIVALVGFWEGLAPLIAIVINSSGGSWQPWLAFPLELGLPHSAIVAVAVVVGAVALVVLLDRAKTSRR
ncbi:hypothetical protein [Amycolatopsis sp. CA-230715]|uniref:hypothetical protein n=1 Tax=Amycolatopsis sp. CA-230715 TaxID=2745196 RepID=UPI001C009E11|nr:hypothetical protein [Amycolatopsis sp. CA-230715]QWF83837.1 hypothetical protein HUW46_07280 [Amycolatopsis sp. CA-230715]